MTKELETYILNRFTKGHGPGYVVYDGRLYFAFKDEPFVRMSSRGDWVPSHESELWQLACRAAIAHYWPSEVLP